VLGFGVEKLISVSPEGGKASRQREVLLDRGGARGGEGGEGQSRVCVAEIRVHRLGVDVCLLGGSERGPELVGDGRSSLLRV